MSEDTNADEDDLIVTEKEAKVKQAYKESEELVLEKTKLPNIEDLLAQAKRMSREELIKSQFLVKHPEIAPEVNKYLKEKHSSISQVNEIEEPIPTEEQDRTEQGQRPSAEFERTKLTDQTRTQDQKLREMIEEKKNAYVRKIAATGKVIIKIFGMREGTEDVWFKLECNYRDLLMGEQKVLRMLKAKEVDLRRQLDYYDVIRGKADPDYHHIMEKLATYVWEWQQKTLEYYYGISATDFDLLHAQDVNIAIEVAIYREQNLYPNFRKTSDDFFTG